MKTKTFIIMALIFCALTAWNLTVVKFYTSWKALKVQAKTDKENLTLVELPIARNADSFEVKKNQGLKYTLFYDPATGVEYLYFMQEDTGLHGDVSLSLAVTPRYNKDGTLRLVADENMIDKGE